MSVLFISSLHFKAEYPDITRAFLSSFDERVRRTEALYILDDFFEAWIGGDDVDVFQCSIVQSLRQVADGGTRIYLMHGNRDFFIGEAFYRETGYALLPGPSMIGPYGESVPLMYRDNLHTRDEACMRLCRWLHSPLTLWILRHLPLTTRHKLAREPRRENRVQTRTKAVDTIDITPEEVLRVTCKRGVCTLIHGRTHRLAEHPLDIDGQPTRCIMPDDWDYRDWALEVDASGRRQASFLL